MKLLKILVVLVMLIPLSLALLLIKNIHGGLLVGLVAAFVFYSWSWLTRKAIRVAEDINLTDWLQKFRPMKIEDEFWTQALRELQSDSKTSSLWAKLLSQSGGNNEKAEALYLKKRAEQLQIQAFVNASENAALQTQRTKKIEDIPPSARPRDIQPQVQILIAALQASGCKVSQTQEDRWIIESPDGKHHSATTEFELERILVDAI